MPYLAVSSKSVFTIKRKEITMKKTEMSRLSLYIPTVLYNRIDSDSQRYGITKTALLQTMIVNYYRMADSSAVKISASDNASSRL